VNEKKPKRSRDIGDRPRPVAPVSTLYMFTDKQTGESGLVWGTRIEIEVMQGLPRYQDSGKVPFPIKVKSIGHVIPVTMPVRHHPMMVDDYDEWITPEKGYEVVDEQEGWQIHPPKSQLIVGEEELKLEAAGSLRLQMDSRKDDGIRHLYFQVLEGDPKLILRFMVGEDTLIGSTMSHRTADGGEYSMYNCKLITPITVDDTPARLRHGCIEYDVIEEARVGEADLRSQNVVLRFGLMQLKRITEYGETEMNSTTS